MLVVTPHPFYWCCMYAMNEFQFLSSVSVSHVFSHLQRHLLSYNTSLGHCKLQYKNYTKLWIGSFMTKSSLLQNEWQIDNKEASKSNCIKWNVPSLDWFERKSSTLHAKNPNKSSTTPINHKSYFCFECCAFWTVFGRYSQKIWLPFRIHQPGTCRLVPVCTLYIDALMYILSAIRKSRIQWYNVKAQFWSWHWLSSWRTSDLYTCV